MTTKLTPYLTFSGNAREAMEFYHLVFGGTLDISTFADFHAAQDSAEENLVMHSQLVTPGNLTLVGADVRERMPFTRSDNVSVVLSSTDNNELRGYWADLMEGATIIRSLTTAAWGDAFGMLRDRFGITWRVNIAAQLPQQ